MSLCLALNQYSARSAILTEFTYVLVKPEQGICLTWLSNLAQSFNSVLLDRSMLTDLCHLWFRTYDYLKSSYEIWEASWKFTGKRFDSKVIHLETVLNTCCGKCAETRTALFVEVTPFWCSLIDWWTSLLLTAHDFCAKTPFKYSRENILFFPKYFLKHCLIITHNMKLDRLLWITLLVYLASVVSRWV